MLYFKVNDVDWETQWDPRTGELRHNGIIVRLTAKERKLISALAREQAMTDDDVAMMRRLLRPETQPQSPSRPPSNTTPPRPRGAT